MRTKAIELIAGAAIAAGASLAIAQSAPPSSSQPSTPTTTGDSFGKLDADKDGMVSKKEASKNKELAAKWDTLDTNKDGKLDQGEFAAFEIAPPPKY